MVMYPGQQQQPYVMPNQPMVVAAPENDDPTGEYHLATYLPFWLGVPITLFITTYFFEHEETGSGIVQCIPASIWIVVLIIVVRCGCMNTAWSVVLLALTVATMAAAAWTLMVIADRAFLKVMFNKVLTVALPVPMLIASILTFFYK